MNAKVQASSSKFKWDESATAQNRLLDADATLFESLDVDDFHVRGSGNRRNAAKPLDRAKMNKWSRLALNRTSHDSEKENNLQLKTGTNVPSSSFKKVAVLPDKPSNINTAKSLVQETNSKCNISEKKSQNASVKQLENDADVDDFKVFCKDGNLSQSSLDIVTSIEEQIAPVKQNVNQTISFRSSVESLRKKWALQLSPEPLKSPQQAPHKNREFTINEPNESNPNLQSPSLFSSSSGSDPKHHSYSTRISRTNSKDKPNPAKPPINKISQVVPETGTNATQSSSSLDIVTSIKKQISPAQNANRTKSSQSSLESLQKKWDLKLLPGPLEPSQQASHKNRASTTIKSNENKVNLQSPILFSSSSDSDPKHHSYSTRFSQANSKAEPNSAKPPINKISEGVSPQVEHESSQSQFSQLFQSTQVVKQVNEAIMLEEQRALKQRTSLETNFVPVEQNNCLLPPSNPKRKSLESPSGKPKVSRVVLANAENILNSNSNKPVLAQNENLTNSDIEYRMTQLLKTSQYRKNVSQMFEKMEHSICQLGPNRDMTHGKQSNVEEGTDWLDDSFMADAMLNGLTQTENGSINDVIKRALKENAKKDVEPKTLVNRTLVPGEATFRNLGPFYGLPSKVLDLIKLYKGIEKLYDWQDECLNLPAVSDRKNLIYSLPTSGGKTLVAEVLILREIICRRRNVIFVLPYVAIVQEKVWALSPFAVALDFLIEEYAAGKGNYPPKKRRYKNSVFIATTEKALGLIYSLVEQGRLEELGLVVVDELHLIGDEQRGPKLEALLTKLMYLNEDIQIVGMSATIGNLPDIQQFLKAEVYTRNFRPVELTEHVKCGDQIAKINWNAEPDHVFEFVRKVDFSYSDSVTKIDPDHLGGLVMEVVPKGSCLIFCSSKRSCENVTRLLCKIVFPQLKSYKIKEKQQLLRALKEESGTLCSILEVSVSFGIAYHHSGLTSEERKLIEEAYRAGTLSLICCTSTLAAGVNLPAKRVIIRRPFIATDFISLSRYKQMVGRAGRAGFGAKGESILICDKTELPKVKELLVSPMDQTLSRMHENESSYLRNLFLSCISLGTANTKAQLEKVAAMTLLAVQQKKLDVDMKKLVRSAMTDLFVLGAIQTFKESQMQRKESSGSLADVSICMNSQSGTFPMSSHTSEGKSQGSSKGIKPKRRIMLEATDKLVVSKLGCAAIKGCLELAKAHVLYEDLQKAQESLVLIDCLHLLYLVTPYNTLQQIRVDKNHLHNIMTKLGDRERKTASVLGITDFCIIRLYSNKPIKTVEERVINKFYTALMLYDLWNEVPVVEVSEKYQVNRGIVQNLMTNASSFASNVVNFCEELEEFWAFAHLLKGMSQRLAHCCCRELSPLMELPAVKQNRARQLYNAGFKTLQSIAKADPNHLIEPIEFMSRRLASQLIAAAKLLLLEKVETLREEAEDVLDGIDNPKVVFNQSFLK